MIIRNKNKHFAFDDIIIKVILSANKNGVTEVKDLKSVRDLIFNSSDYIALAQLLQSNQLDVIGKIPERELPKDQLCEYLMIYTFVDQNNIKYIAIIYDSDALWQDPELIELFIEQ